MSKQTIDAIEKDFFHRGNPLKKLLSLSMELLQAEQVGVLYGTNASKKKFLPYSEWDRGVMDRFDGRGIKGWILKWFGTSIVTLKKLSPVYFYKTDPNGQLQDNDGIIAHILRTCDSYYRKGISILFSPDISTTVFKINDQYAEIPFYSYNGQTLKDPDIRVKVDLNIIRHFQAKNYVSIYIPDYGILVANSVDPHLMERIDGQFVKEQELKAAFDLLIRLVETVSLATLGQLKGQRGAQLLWQKEKLLRQTSTELVENEKKYRDLYENAPVAYFSMDINGTILKCNYKTLQLSGYNRTELIGKNAAGFYVDAGGKTATPEQVRQLLTENKSTRDIEMMFKNKQHQDVWISLSLDAVRDRNAKITEVRAMAVDISERKSLEKQLLYAQKMEAIGTLAGGIAHDFNNILSPISGYAEMLLMESDTLDAKKKEHLQIIHDCAQYAKSLVNQVLTFSDQKDNEFKLLQPHTFVEDALFLTKSFMPATIDVRQTIRQDCGRVLVDPVQAHQVVMNLVSNAYHAMEKTGGRLEIILDETHIKDSAAAFPLTPGTYVLLKVSDTGPGIPPDIIERIFDPFFTTKEEGKGSGIGLSVVHGIVQSHSGHIRVTSTQGEGTSFEVYLPVHRSDTPLQETPTRSPVEERPVATGTERILLVDDNKKVAFMVQHMLENLGYHVSCYLESREALAAITAGPNDFDLVLTDLTMPHLTGYELAKAITQLRPDIPIILCTGFGEHINKEQYSLQGIKGFLHKPISVRGASHLIRDILDQQPTG